MSKYFKGARIHSQATSCRDRVLLRAGLGACQRLQELASRLLLQLGADGAAVTAWAEQRGLERVHDVANDGIRPAVRRWRAGPDGFVEYVHEVWLGIHYLRATGPDHARLIDQARADLASWQREDLLSLWDGAAEDLSTLEAATCALGIVAAPVLDMEAFTRLARSMVHPSARVRFLAVRSALIAGHPVLVPALRDVAAHDPDPEVRRHAGLVANEIERCA